MFTLHRRLCLYETSFEENSDLFRWSLVGRAQNLNSQRSNLCQDAGLQWKFVDCGRHGSVLTVGGDDLILADGLILSIEECQLKSLDIARSKNL